MKKLLIASKSTIYGSEYLEYLLPTLKYFFRDVKTILFIPYARPSGISYEHYTEMVKNAFGTIKTDVKGIHLHKKFF
ncbi:MAG: dipeptidase E [Polaribacter sp.]|jgi:dipeptidase E